jgi:hypothetical protein
MSAAPGPRTFECRGNLQLTTRTQKGGRVFSPASFVKVDCHEEARFISEQRIDASDERLTRVVATRQVPSDDVIGDRQESLMGTFAAFDTWLLADASHPFVGACRCVAGFARLAILEAPWVDVVASTKERPEERDLGFWGSGLLDET